MNDIKLTTIEEDLRLELERLARLYPELCPTDQVNRTVGNIAMAVGRGVDGFQGIVDAIIGLIQNAMRKRSSDQEVMLNLFVLVSAIYLASKNEEQAKNKGRVILAS
jgi:hypothetical protein